MHCFSEHVTYVTGLDAKVKIALKKFVYKFETFASSPLCSVNYADTL